MLQIYKKKHFHLQKPLFFHLINATGHKKGDRERLKRRFLSQKNFNSSILQFFNSLIFSVLRGTAIVLEGNEGHRLLLPTS